MRDIDALANKFAELSDCEVSEDKVLDSLVQQYREGKISKKELLNAAYEYTIK